ncbi:minor tail protein [Microbacterium phage Platte]|nr:minor tail protein [Microbacterium phage OlinDD]QZD97643.1 minor tail protein [Microbacterium phage Platte]
MGVMLTIGGRRVHPEVYTVSESSTPLAGGDSSGAIGTIEVEVPQLPFSPIGLNAQEELSLVDTRLGSTIGTTREVSNSRTAASGFSVMAANRLGEFNIETQVQPFTGRLEDAFRYYCSLANIDTGIVVDSAIANRQVNFLGWNGNLWNHMKMMATAISADLNLISNNVVLRPVRLFDAIRNRNVDSDATIDSTDLARKQEVIWYPSEYVERGLIYPSGGYRSDIAPLSVSAGETVEVTLDSTKDVFASIFSIEQPVAQSFVSMEHDSSSVYSVVGDDGLPIPPAQWADFGGSLSVRISDDTQALVVTMTGATGLYQTNGQPMKTFRIGIASGTSSTDTYSTLRVVGRYVSTRAQSIILPTGVPDFRTGQEFAPTIDNPFLNTLDAAYSAGIRGARRYAGRRMTVTASVSSLNRRGQTGTANYPPYSYAQGLWGGMTYGGVRALNASRTYASVREEFYQSVQDTFDNQVFGNAPGARFWDQPTGRYYRVRQATTTWGDMQIEGDDDLTNGDVQLAFGGMTYGQVGMRFSGQTYYKANVRGLL